MMNHSRRLLVLSIAITAALGWAGCSANKAALKGGPGSGTQAGAGNAEEPSVRGSLLRQVPEVETAHFAYDSAVLDPQERTLLKKNAVWLRSHAGYKIQIAGYCDERGTVEYNLALGERRATAVRNYYRDLGIAKSRIATISYGKERPLCGESTEACWARNRRAETLVAAASL